MAMEMRQELKLSQQLVMTPQLQQAIRLLQLSRMELAELVHDEMLENPILDDEMDLDNERSREKDEMGGDEQALHQLEGAGSTETPIDGSVVDGIAQTEVKGDANAVNEIDWENYLDNYSMGPPMPAFRGDGEELPSLEATLTKPASLHDHLAWQLKMTNLPQQQLEVVVDRVPVVLASVVGDLVPALDGCDQIVHVVVLEGLADDPAPVGGELRPCLLLPGRLHPRIEDPFHVPGRR